MPNTGIDNNRRRRWWITVAIVLLVAAAIAIGTMHLLPVGLGGPKHIIPFLFFTLNRGTYSSPDSRSRVEIYSNDGGAMHSGTFPSWVVRRHWWGAEVIAKGYLMDSRGPVPLKWVGSRTATIVFVKGKHDYTPAPQTIELE